MIMSSFWKENLVQKNFLKGLEMEDIMVYYNIKDVKPKQNIYA